MHNPSGRIELICGPMFAGKTTELIRRLAAARQCGDQVIACKPARDTRYGMARVTTHAGTSWPAAEVHSVADLHRAVQGAAVVAVDEVHFFEAPMADALAGLTRDADRVIAAGVDLDHRGEPFAVITRLLEIAGEVTRLTARCARCGAEARYTQRLIAGEDRIVVGGQGDYEPRCAACFEWPG